MSDAVREAVSAATARPAAAHPTPAGRPTVLVVDDEDGLRTVLSELLRQDGFTVIEAASGAEALARAGEQPAVIVLDVGLPDLDGFEVCRRLRADPSTAPIPVLQISGMFRDVEDQVRGLETGADAYLTRPVEQAELVTTVRALLRVRRAEAGLRESESRRRAAEVLADVGRVLAQSLDPAEVGQRIASTVRALLGAEVSTLYRLGAETGDLVAVATDGDVGPTGGRPVVMPRGSGVSGLAVRQRAPVVTPDWLADPRISVPPEVRARAEQAEFRAVLAVPLLIQDRVTGALAVGARAGRAFDATAIRLAQALADQAALALENARLYAETHERLRETQILLAIARVLSLSLPAEEAMRQVSRSVARAFGADMVGMYVLDGRRQALVPIAGYHVPPELRRQFREAAFPVTAYAGPAEAWETLQPAWTGEAMGDPRWFSGELLAGFPPHSVLFAPTPVHGVPVGGLFLVWWRPGRVPTAAELRLVAGIATQVGLALENAELERRTRQKLGETEALLDIARAISSTLELRDLLRLVTQRTARVVGADRCAVNLWRAGHLVPVMGQFADGRTDTALWARFRAARPDGLEGSPGHAEVLRTRQPLVVDDVRHPRGVLGEWVEALGVRAALIVPLIHQDRVIGTLCLDRTDGPHRWEDAEVHLATSIAAQAALAVENAGLYQRAAERADKQRTLATLTALITQAADSAEVVRAVARAASTLLGARLARVWVDDPARRVLRVRGTSWPEGAAGGVGVTVSGVGYGEGMAGRVFLAGQPIYVEDLAGDERVADRRLVAEAGLRAYAGLPLVAGDRTLGVLSLLFAERRQFDAEEAELMRLLADHAAIALRNARLYEEVRNTRDFLQSIAENSADAIITTDIHGQITYLSPAGEEMFGFRGAETVGTHVGEYYRGGVDEARHVMRRLRLEGRVTNHETEIRTRAGGWVKVNGSFSLLRDTSGLVIGTLGVTKDVTEQKRAEAAVRAGDARFRALIEHSSDAIALTDARGICLYASPATARILGWGPDALVGRDVADLVHAEDRPGVTGRLAQLLERPGTAVASGEFRVRHRDGSWRWIEGVGSNLLGEPSVRALVLNYRDATERRTLEEHLRHSQKMDAVGRLAGGVAHDFNNLLTVILGRSELILSRLDPAAPSARDIKLVLQTGERAMSLTRQLLAFSRGQVLQPRVIDLDGVVADMEQMLRRLIGEHLDLVTRPGSGGGRVRVDPGQLEQVLLNLAVNARDAMPHGGRLTIETASVEVADAAPQRPVGIPPGRYLRLAVSDTGVGMDAATQSRLFEPFFTTKELGKGTGLGLATVYGIVTQSGGQIVVASEPGAGTRFEIYFPQVEASPAASDARSAPLRLTAPTGSETILLVEDDQRLRDLAHEVLAMQGYDVLVAPDPEEALRTCAAHAGPIHLLLTDVVMPHMSGRELADRLTPLRPETRVLYMSGYTDDAILHHGVHQAEVDLLQKPFTPVGLAQRVREALDAVEASAPHRRERGPRAEPRPPGGLEGSAPTG